MAVKEIGQLQNELEKQLPSEQVSFIMSQVKNCCRKQQGKRWSYKDKALALTLLHSSRATYRLLQRVFQLPSVKTLKIAMRNMVIYPGYNETIFQALEKKLKKAPATSISGSSY